MNGYFDLDFSNVSFEWDEEKERVNFRKHGIHFRTAAKVFLDPNMLVREDRAHGSEERYNVLGSVGKVLFVVCVFRSNDRIRLISARFATRNEKERYYHGICEYE